jgi:hypothetical protein
MADLEEWVNSIFGLEVEPEDYDGDDDYFDNDDDEE